MIPFTYPPEPVGGMVISGYGRPERPAIPPEMGTRLHETARPRHRTPPDGRALLGGLPAFTQRMLVHVGEVAEVCRLVIELEPNLTCCRRLHELGSHRPPRLESPRPRAPGARPSVPGTRSSGSTRRSTRHAPSLRSPRGLGRGADRDRALRPRHASDLLTFHLNRWLEEAGHLRYRTRRSSA